MANEFTFSMRFKYRNGINSDDGPNLGTLTINQNGPPLSWRRTIALVAGVDTDVAALVAGITTNGVCYFANADPTNYVQWGPPNPAGGAIVVQGRLEPNDWPALFRLDPAAGLHMKANAGNVDVLVFVAND